MLQQNQILDIIIGTTEWDSFWCGKLSSSQISCLTAKDSPAESSYDYLVYKAMEKFCAVKKTTVDLEIQEEDNKEWGKLYEPAALEFYKQLNPGRVLEEKKVIASTDGQSGTIPDALSITRHKESMYAHIVEVKCPKTYKRFYSAMMCKTPEDIKQFDRRHYWQLIDEMLVSSAFTGEMFYYHPEFPKDVSYNSVAFNKNALFEDFLFLDQRKKLATTVMESYIENITSIRNSRMMQ
jgi:hypothetical protein